MAVTLAEAADASTDMIQRGVIQTFIDYSPVLDRLPLMEIEGSAYQYTQEATLPGVAWRGVNDSYTESTGTVNPLTEGLKILGGDADVDRFIQQTMSNLNDQRGIQTRLKTKALAYEWNESFFEGDSGVDANQVDGLRTRLTGSQVILAGAGGATLTLDMLDELIDAVLGGPDAIYMPKWLIRKVNALQRAAGVALEPIESYGRRVLSYAGVPIIDPGVGADGATDILAFDEDPGDATADTASVYAVKFGAQEFVSGLTNGGVMVDDLGMLETKPAFRTRIEFYVGIANFNGKSAARLRGVTQT